MTDKHYYKLDEFKGNIPNPKEFPTKGSNILTAKDCPNIFGDGFMLDLAVDESERLRLKEKAIRVVPKVRIDHLIEEVNSFKILLSEPQYIYNNTLTAYVLYSYFQTMSNLNKLVGIQVKYYRYFRNRYPECKFYTRDIPISMIAIRDGDVLVGLCMPIVLPKMEE